MTQQKERKEILLDILKMLVIFLGLLFLISYFITQYAVIIEGFLQGFFKFTTVAFFYIIHTIVLSILVFTLFILFVKRICKKTYFKIIDITTGKDITDLVEIQISIKNKNGGIKDGNENKGEQ